MYVLVTPVKNEAKNLTNVIQSVINQSLKPAIWVIVDDNSCDDTPKIISYFENNVSWIKVFKLNEVDMGFNSKFGFVVKEGIRHAKELIEISNIDIQFIGVLDADILLNNDYFAVLLQYMKQNRKCGVVSGLLHEEHKEDFEGPNPRGGARLYRKECLDSIEDYPVVPRHETIFDIKAINRGWKTVKIKDTSGFHARPVLTRKGLLHGYIKRGEADNYLHYHPVNAILSGISLCFCFPYYIGLAYLYGYLVSFKLKRDYFYRELNNNLVKKLCLRK